MTSVIRSTPLATTMLNRPGAAPTGWATHAPGFRRNGCSCTNFRHSELGLVRRGDVGGLAALAGDPLIQNPPALGCNRIALTV